MIQDTRWNLLTLYVNIIKHTTTSITIDLKLLRECSDGNDKYVWYTLESYLLDVYNGCSGTTCMVLCNDDIYL